MISHFLNNHKFTMDIPFPFGRRSFQSEFIDQATHQQVEEFIQNILNKIAQQEVEINNITFTQWAKNIYSYGSFSFPTPEYSEALVQTFNQPIADTLFFAGEHCSAQYAGTVYGTYLSGYETAQQILAINN